MHTKILSTHLVMYALIMVATTLPNVGYTASVSLSPTSIPVQEGRPFSVAITIDPRGLTDYVEKLEILYPTELVRLDSFVFSPSWIPLNQPQYDSIDTVHGIIIKTAGYPGGLKVPTLFGTMNFTPRTNGSGYITVGSNSLSYHENSQSQIGGNFVTFSVAPETARLQTRTSPTITPRPTPSPTVVQSTPQQPEPLEAIPPETRNSETTQAAAAVSAPPVQNNLNGWLWVGGIIVLLAVAGSIAYAIRK